jgi:RecA-family ATPase
MVLSGLGNTSRAQSRTTVRKPTATSASWSSKKNQYGPLGETLILRYQRGLFLPEKGISTLERAAAEEKADRVFIENIVRLEKQGRNVSAKPNAPTYAPATFAKEPGAKEAGLRKSDFEAAMHRLLDSGKIRVESYGPPHRGWTKLVTA